MVKKNHASLHIRFIFNKIASNNICNKIQNY